ncbi:PREDICTED: contactin-1-like, partial [Apaloderma vittatum]|uniref:contactin-1-like n=1 Tax=Apaloderma vittatum TaxID=57397 RepID=UPI000521B48E
MKKETKAVGESVTFHLQNPERQDIVWNFRGEIIVLVRPGHPPSITFYDKSYEQRLTVSEKGDALTISQLTTNDAGTYTATIPGDKTTFTLRVYRELTAPTVTCTAINCSADSCNYTLRCTALGSGLGDVSYVWFMGGLLWVEGPTVQ